MPWYDHPDNPTDPRAAILLTFFSGLILLLMAVFKLGFLVNYVSHAVITGFTCAAAIIISFSQLKKLLGLKNIRRHFYEAIVDIPLNLKHTRWQDFLIGVFCMIILHFMKYAKEKWTAAEPSDTGVKKVVRKIAWFACTARNAVVIILVTIVGYGLDPTASNIPLTLTGKLQGGLPKPGAPEFSGDYWVSPDVKIMLEYVPESSGHHRRRRDIQVVDTPIPDEVHDEVNDEVPDEVHDEVPDELQPTTSSNITSSYCAEDVPGCVLVHVPASKFIPEIMSGVMVVAIMGYVESIAIAKGFGRKNNYKVDPDQELVAIGIANLGSSFFKSYPVTGSFSRTAVNAQSGVATPAGGIVTGVLVLIATQFLTPLFQYIPSAALAAVIMLAAISMFDSDGIKHAWMVNKMDLVPLVLTFLVCFYEIAVSL